MPLALMGERVWDPPELETESLRKGTRSGSFGGKFCFVCQRICVAEWLGKRRLGQVMKSLSALLLIVVVVLTCVGLAQTQQGHVLLGDVGLYQAPATYTELSFAAPETLPHYLARPNGTVTVSFDIHNAENADHPYQWSILFVQGSESQVKASGMVVTPAGGQTGITSRVAASCTGGRMQVVVRLASPAESISFWMTCPPAAPKRQAAQ